MTDWNLIVAFLLQIFDMQIMRIIYPSVLDFGLGGNDHINSQWRAFSSF